MAETSYKTYHAALGAEIRVMEDNTLRYRYRDGQTVRENLALESVHADWRRVFEHALELHGLQTERHEGGWIIDKLKTK